MDLKLNCRRLLGTLTAALALPAFGRRDAYSVLLLAKDGNASVYASCTARAPG